MGSAHALKLINNLVALGYAAVWAECFGMARKIGVPAAVLREVVTNSGMNCPNFQNFAKYPVDGDREGHRFSIANAFKDLSYYEKMATRHQAATLMSDGALQTLKLGMAMGMGERYVPEMSDIVVALNEPGPQGLTPDRACTTHAQPMHNACTRCGRGSERLMAGAVAWSS